MAFKKSLPFRIYAFENMLLATLSGATAAALIKGVATTIPDIVVVFLRGTVGCLIALPLLWIGRCSLTRVGISKHIARGICGAGSVYCYYYAIRHLFVDEAVLLRSTAPLFVPLVSYIALGERITAPVFLGLVLGMSGVYLTLSPSISLSIVPSIIGLCSGLLTAFSMVILRVASTSESEISLAYYYSLIIAVIMSVPAIHLWVCPSFTDILFIGLASIFAMLGQYLMAKAISMSSVTQMSPLYFTIVIFSAAYSYVFWGRSFSTATIIGIILVGIAAFIVKRSAPPRSVKGVTSEN